jgi:hypothetical protein
VAREPTVKLGSQFSVTGYAERHLEIDPLQTVRALHVAVTVRAIELCPLYMRNMVEVDVVRNPEDSRPRNRGIDAKIPFLILDLRMLRNNILMAKEAFLHRGKTGAG